MTPEPLGYYIPIFRSDSKGITANDVETTRAVMR